MGTLATVCLALVALVARATVRYTGSDPYGALLVADQLSTRGTIALDAYGPAVTQDNWRVVLIDGHAYYTFPLGTPILLAPFVRLATLLGAHLPAHDRALQVLLGSLLVALTFLLLFALARQYLRWGVSVTLALVFCLGTSLASTNGTALWSHDVAVVLGTVSLILLVRQAQRPGAPWESLALGLSLYCGYLVRPAMLLLVPCALVLLWVGRRRRDALLAAAVVVALAALFSLFSMRTFGTLVPSYYQANEQLSARLDVVAELGLLVSPSRGLLLYTPLLLVLPLLAWLSRARLRERAGPLLLCVSWIVLTLLALGTFPGWYGGASFGPRLLTDVIPAFFLLTVLLWPDAFPGVVGTVTLVLACVLAVLSIAINTRQGLFNRATLDWNFPAGRQTADVLWDWRYPQLLHTDARQAQRDAEWAQGPQGAP